MMNSQEAKSDVLIVGGGILGIFYAYHAIQAGLRVVLLERNAAARGASVRNFGMVVPSGLNKEWQRYGRDSLSIYKSIHEKFQLPIREQGSIYLASDDEEVGLIEELHERNQAADYQSELWTTEQCQRRYSQLRSDYCQAGLFFPQELSVEPGRLNARLHEYLNEQSTYQSFFLTNVIALETSKDETVKAITNTGMTIRAQVVIICCGDELRALYPDALQTSDIDLVKLQMLRLTPQPATSLPGNVLTGRTIRRYECFSECPSWETMKSNEDTTCFEQAYGIHILFKQETNGSILLGDSHEYASSNSSERLSFELRSDINNCFVERAKEIFDLPTWDIATSWYGVYAQTGLPEGIFNVEVEPNVHISTAIGGKGMTSSAGFAKQDFHRIWN